MAAIKPALVGGVEGFEFMLSEPSYGIRALTTDTGTLLLATPGQCQHLRARERCVDDRLKTEVEAQGKVACLGPASFSSDHVFISLNEGDGKQKLVFGEPLLIDTSRGDVSFDIFVPGSDKSAGHVKRRRDDSSNPLPEELLALLKPGGYEKAAMPFFKGLKASQKTAALEAKISTLRAAGAKRVVANFDMPGQLVDMIRLHTMKAMPGDDAVFDAVASRIREVLPKLADGDVSDDDFKMASVAFLFYSKRSGEALDLRAVEAKYGPKLGTAWAKSRDLQEAFASMFPESRFVQEMTAVQAKEVEERRERQARQAAEADDQALWEEVQGRGDDIATLGYKIQFGHQNFVKTKHNVRGLAAMQKYRDGLVRDAFCPAKRAFLRAKGAAEYNQRAAEHCKDSAPVDVGIGGVEKVLTTECRAAFATGC